MYKYKTTFNPQDALLRLVILHIVKLDRVGLCGDIINCLLKLNLSPILEIALVNTPYLMKACALSLTLKRWGVLAEESWSGLSRFYYRPHTQHQNVGSTTWCKRLLSR